MRVREKPPVGYCWNCLHIWQEHLENQDGEYECGECSYEIEHDEPEAPQLVCTERPPLGFRRY